jgi:hypothetical protein
VLHGSLTRVQMLYLPGVDKRPMLKENKTVRKKERKKEMQSSGST